MFDGKNECKECGRTFKTMDPFGRHLSRIHHMTLKEYYDKYFKDENEGKCETCGKETEFSGKLRFGYKRFCCNECVGQNENVQKRKIRTTQKHFGVDNPRQSKEIKERCKQTCLEKYGTEYPSQNVNVKQKTKDTMIERYGDVISRVQEFKDKARETSMNKYGTEWYTQTDEFRKRFIETCKERYGTEYPIQNAEIFKKTKRKFEYDGTLFDSKWEIIFYMYLKRNNIKFEYQPKIKFEYEYEGKKHFYKPDFLLEDGRIIEIKGPQFFKDGKMINPWKHEQDGMFEAKHQCMLRNKVIIIMDINQYK